MRSRRHQGVSPFMKEGSFGSLQVDDKGQTHTFWSCSQIQALLQLLQSQPSRLQRIFFQLQSCNLKNVSETNTPKNSKTLLNADANDSPLRTPLGLFCDVLWHQDHRQQLGTWT